MEEIMIYQTKKTLKDGGSLPTSSPTKKHFLKGCIALLTSFVFTSDAHASGRGIDEEQLFHGLHPDFSKTHIKTPQEAVRELEIQHAKKFINGVISMYRENVEFGFGIGCYNIETQSFVSELNASYTPSTRTFDLPRVRRNAREIVHTAMDQGIVSHEAGHMVLYYLCLLGRTSHTDAIHEAFGDLTSHFYRFYNLETRQEFITRLKIGQGCVGDTDFTCTRDSYQPLTLSHVERDQELCEPHSFSKAFSSAIYRSIVNAFAKRKLSDKHIGDILGWHKGMLVSAVQSLDSYPTLMDLAQQMLMVSYSNSKYRNDLGENFIKNGLIVIIYKSFPYRYSPNEKFAKLCLTKKGHSDKEHFWEDLD